MKRATLVLGAFVCLLAALMSAGDANAVDQAKESPLLRRTLQYERVLTTPTGVTPEQHHLLALTLAAAETQTTDPAEFSTILRQLDVLTTYLLMSDTSYTWDGAQWVYSHRTTYAYETGHHVAEEIREDWDVDHWVNSSRQVYTYDGQGRPSTSTYQTWDTDHWVDEFLYTYTYDGSGNMIEMLGQTWDGGDWVNSLKVSMTYSAGRLATSTWQYWLLNDWVNAFRTTYTYTPGGDLAQTVAESWQLTDWVNQTRTTYTYNGSGQETQIVTEWWQEGTGWVNQYNDEYSYDGSGHEVLHIRSNWGTSNWVAQDADTSKYSGDQLYEEVHYGIQSGSLRRTDYTYDGNGNLIEDVDQNWNVSEWVNSSRGVYVYVAADVDNTQDLRPTGYEVEQNYPNPFNGPTVIVFNAETTGPAAVEIFNILGQQVFARRLETVTPGRQSVTWDGYDQTGRPAPSGLYLYRVTVDGAQETRKMVLLK